MIDLQVLSVNTQKDAKNDEFVKYFDGHNKLGLQESTSL